MITWPKKASFSRWARPLSEGLLVAMLVACGGSGQNQSGLILPGTPTAASTVPQGSAASAAPGAGATSPPPPPSAPTLAEQIAALERSGAYPALDRSTDIVGPDVNKNGVRDDIEAWINSLNVSDGQRKALLQDARATQRALVVDLKDQAALQRVGESFGASMKCGAEKFASFADFSTLAGRIEAMTANTKERAMRYIEFNAARSGSSTKRPSGNTCEP
jgi:hypothetical protein